MPRIDPITGVPVLTTAEFFDHEAKREGKGRSGGEVMAETYAQMAKEINEERQQFYNPKFAKDVLNEAIKDQNSYSDDKVLLVKKVKKVLEVDYQVSFRNDSLKLRAEAVDENGKTGIICLCAFSCSGSFYEPPDEESEVDWEAADKKDIPSK